MQLKRWTCWLGLVFAVVTTSLGAEGPAELLQKGLFEEEANHDLQSAIKAYQSVIQQTDEHRRLGATAIFRLGECYRKLGQTNEALVQYRRVLREFPDQERLMQASQELINELQPSAAKPSSSTPLVGNPFTAPVLLSEEARELERLQAIAKESPDLLNARVDNEKHTLLHQAARNGWMRVAEFLVSQKAEVNALDSERKTPLHLAAVKGHRDLVQFLLSHGAEVNARDKTGRTALHEAAGNGYKTVVEALLMGKGDVDAPSNIGLTPLHCAALGGHRVTVEILLKNNANVNARTTGQLYELGRSHPAGLTPLFLAAMAEQPGVAELLCQAGAEVNATDQELNTPLHYAASFGALKAIDVLLKHKAKANVQNKSGFSPLHVIIRSTSDPEPVTLLIAAGADPNAMSSDGMRPLVTALVFNNIRHALALLQAKADPNATNRYGATALHEAVRKPSEEMVELLLSNKANPNAQDSNGRTPLHSAVAKLRSMLPNEGYSTIVRVAKMLLAHKADVNVPDNEGKTPLNYFGIPAQIQKNGDQEMIALLKEHGATDELPQLPPNPKVIRIWRKGLPQGFPMWTKPSAGESQFTLLEAIWSYYRSSPQKEGYPAPVTSPTEIPAGFRPSPLDDSYDFPDLSQITIHRLTDEKNYEKIKVNLLHRGAINCPEDMKLAFGDVIEIPEKEHALGAPRAGLDETLHFQIKECVAQHVQLVAKGSRTELTLNPGSGRYLSQVLKMPEALKVLVSSSDFSRVKIIRQNKATGKAQTMIVNENPFRQGTKPLWEDLLLIEGDIVEVPELSKN